MQSSRSRLTEIIFHSWRPSKCRKTGAVITTCRISSLFLIATSLSKTGSRSLRF